MRHRFLSFIASVSIVLPALNADASPTNRFKRWLTRNEIPAVAEDAFANHGPSIHGSFASIEALHPQHDDVAPSPLLFNLFAEEKPEPHSIIDLATGPSPHPPEEGLSHHHLLIEPTDAVAPVSHRAAEKVEPHHAHGHADHDHGHDDGSHHGY